MSMADEVFIDREYSGSIITQNEGFLVLLGFEEGNLCLNEKIEAQNFGEEAISEVIEILSEKEDFLKEKIVEDRKGNLRNCFDEIIEEEHIHPFFDYVFGEDSAEEDCSEDLYYEDEEDCGDMDDYNYDFDFDLDEDDEDDCDYDEIDDEDENFFEDEDDEDYDGSIASYFADPNHWPED